MEEDITTNPNTDVYNSGPAFMLTFNSKHDKEKNGLKQYSNAF